MSEAQDILRLLEALHSLGGPHWEARKPDPYNSGLYLDTSDDYAFASSNDPYNKSGEFEQEQGTPEALDKATLYGMGQQVRYREGADRQTALDRLKVYSMLKQRFGLPIGRGAFRVVFDTGRGYVVKLGVAPPGDSDNETEARYSARDKNRYARTKLVMMKRLPVLVAEKLDMPLRGGFKVWDKDSEDPGWINRIDAAQVGIKGGRIKAYDFSRGVWGKSLGEALELLEKIYGGVRVAEDPYDLDELLAYLRMNTTKYRGADIGLRAFVGLDDQDVYIWNAEEALHDLERSKYGGVQMGMAQRLGLDTQKYLMARILGRATPDMMGWDWQVTVIKLDRDRSELDTVAHPGFDTAIQELIKLFPGAKVVA